MGYAKKEEVKEIEQVYYGNQDIIVHPAFPDPSPDHDANIRNNGRCEKEKEMYIKQGLIGLFRIHDFFLSK
jgi:hypothetical protein